MNSGELSPPAYGTRAGKSEPRPQLLNLGLSRLSLTGFLGDQKASYCLSEVLPSDRNISVCGRALAADSHCTIAGFCGSTSFGRHFHAFVSS